MPGVPRADEVGFPSPDIHGAAAMNVNGSNEPTVCMVCGREATPAIPLVSLWVGAWNPRRVCLLHFAEAIATSVSAAVEEDKRTEAQDSHSEK